MRNIILILPNNNFPLSLPSSEYKIIKEEDSVWIKNIQGKFVELVHDNHIAIYYDNEELKKIKDIVGEKLNFYLVNFKDISFLKEILFKVADKDNIVIDNDFDLILKGSDFIEICRENNDWDWANYK